MSQDIVQGFFNVVAEVQLESELGRAQALLVASNSKMTWLCLERESSSLRAGVEFRFLQQIEKAELCPDFTHRLPDFVRLKRLRDSVYLDGFDRRRVLDRLTLADGTRLAPQESRRDLMTRSIDLNALVGREFRIGPVLAFGQRLCEPCVHLQRLTRPGVVAGLAHRGGLRADLLTGGEIRVGDRIEAAG